MKKSKEYDIIKKLHTEYKKHKTGRLLVLESFAKRIRGGYTFSQICDMSINDYSTRPRSVSGTYLGLKYIKAINEREINNVNT